MPGVRVLPTEAASTMNKPTVGYKDQGQAANAQPGLRNAMMRQDRILELVKSTETTSVSDLSAQLGVSAVTVRSDLDALERQHLIRRVRGGAIGVRPVRFERPIELPSQRFTEEKERIGKLAASMIRNGETVILDSGSTTLALAHQIPQGVSDVLVVTNCIDIALALHSHRGVEVFLTGGRLKEPHQRDSYRSLIPPMAGLLLAQIHADMAFLSCAGVDARRGFTNRNWAEAELKKTMLQSARQACVVADRGKIGHVGSAVIAGFDAVGTLITDTGASSAEVAELEAAGLRVLLA